MDEAGSPHNPRIQIVLLSGGGSTVAYAHLNAHLVGVGSFILKNIKIVLNRQGEYFLGFPSVQSRTTGKWHDHFNPSSAACREQITRLVLAEFYRATGEKPKEKRKPQTKGEVGF